jgi:Anti-sigma factor NepR
MTARPRTALSCLESAHNEAGLEMAGNEKSTGGGTDPKTGGSDQQTAVQPDRVQRPQQSDMTDKMDVSNKQGPAMVDRWFDRQLNQLYSEVVSEPLPKEFLELIDQLRDKTPTK